MGNNYNNKNKNKSNIDNNNTNQKAKSQKQVKKEKVQKIQQKQKEVKKIKAEEEKQGVIKNLKKKQKTKKVTKIASIVIASVLVLFLVIGGIGSYFYKKSLQVNTIFSEGMVAVKNSNNRWGYITKSGKTKINFKFDNAFNFTKNGLALVSSGNKFFFINKKGENVFNKTYSSAVSFDKNLAIVKNGSFYGAINSEGKTVIPFDYDNINTFVGDYAIAEKYGLYGIIDRIGRTVVDFKYEKIESLNDSYFKYKVGQSFYICLLDTNSSNYEKISELNNGYCIVKSGINHGLLDPKGEVVLESIYISLSYSSGEFLKYSSDGFYYGYMNFDGEVVIREKYNGVTDFNGYGCVNNGDKFSVIDRSGNELYSFEVDGLSPFINGKAIYQKGELFGFINSKGKIICEAKYKYVSYFYDDGFAVVRDNNNNYGIIKSSGKELIKPIYNNISLKEI